MKLTLSTLVGVLLTGAVMALAQAPELDQLTYMPLMACPSPGPHYDCSADLYDCSDFSSQTWAQEAHDFCVARGADDVHQLDGNSDRIACEEAI